MCVPLFTTNPQQNEEAEELMRRVEAAEDAAEASGDGHNGSGGAGTGSGGGASHLHLAIINLVIGTLYCSKVRHAAHDHDAAVTAAFSNSCGACPTSEKLWRTAVAR